MVDVKNQEEFHHRQFLKRQRCGEGGMRRTSDYWHGHVHTSLNIIYGPATNPFHSTPLLADGDRWALWVGQRLFGEEQGGFYHSVLRKLIKFNWNPLRFDHG